MGSLHWRGVCCLVRERGSILWSPHTGKKDRSWSNSTLEGGCGPILLAAHTGVGRFYGVLTLAREQTGSGSILRGAHTAACPGHYYGVCTRRHSTPNHSQPPRVRPLLDTIHRILCSTVHPLLDTIHRILSSTPHSLLDTMHCTLLDTIHRITVSSARIIHTYSTPSTHILAHPTPYTSYTSRHTLHSRGTLAPGVSCRHPAPYCSLVRRIRCRQTAPMSTACILSSACTHVDSLHPVVPGTQLLLACALYTVCFTWFFIPQPAHLHGFALYTASLTPPPHGRLAPFNATLPFTTVQASCSKGLAPLKPCTLDCPCPHCQLFAPFDCSNGQLSFF